MPAKILYIERLSKLFFCFLLASRREGGVGRVFHMSIEFSPTQHFWNVADHEAIQGGADVRGTEFYEAESLSS